MSSISNSGGPGGQGGNQGTPAATGFAFIPVAPAGGRSERTGGPNLTIVPTGQSLSLTGQRLSVSSITGSANDWVVIQRDLTVNSGGTATLAASNPLLPTANLTVNGTFAMAGFSQTVASLTGSGAMSNAAGTSTLTVRYLGGSPITFAGSIGAAGANAVSLAKDGAGSFGLSGANAYTGPTTVSAGTLRLTGSGSFAASPQITVAAGAALDVSGLSGGAN